MTPFKPTVRTRTQMAAPGVRPLRMALPPLMICARCQSASVAGLPRLSWTSLVLDWLAALMLGMALLCFWGEAGTDPFQVEPGEFHFSPGLFQVRGVGIRYGLCGLLLGIVVFA